MRSWKFTPVHVTILEKLSSGKPLREIARSMGLNHTTVMRHAKQLEQRGYISRQVRSSHVIFSILPIGLSNMHHPVRRNLTGGSKDAPPPEDDPKKMKIRLHRLQVKFDLVNPIRDPAVIKFHDFPSEIVPMGPKKSPHWYKNIVSFENFTAIISTKSLIITGVQRYLNMSENIEAQEAKVLEEIMPFAEQVEEKIRNANLLSHFYIPGSSDKSKICRLCNEVIQQSKLKNHAVSRHQSHIDAYTGFKLKRIDRGILMGKIISREIAFEHHPIAELAKRMRIDNEEGKPRIIVDQSKGPELEVVDRDLSPMDAEQLRKNTLTLAISDLNATFSEIAKQASVTQDQMSQVVSALGTISNIIGSTMWRP